MNYNIIMQSVLIIFLTFIAWAVLHSILADFHLKARFRTQFGDRAYRWYRLGYNGFATMSFIPVLLANWLLPDQKLWEAPSPWNWLIRSVQLLSFVGLVLAIFETDVGEYAGLAQLRPGWSPDRKEPMRLSGLYCLVRHPIYFFSLPLIWLSPVLTVNGLTIALLFTLYFYLGAKHEETGLRHEFGPIYDDYRAQVPMLIPRLRRCPPLPQASQANTSGDD